MAANDGKAKDCLGFLTVVDCPEVGLFGGYLVLNRAGRPLEFHCTAPIRPNRAQQILYGPTLEPYLYGEQIGSALVTKSRLEPMVVCTDREPVLAVRPLVSMPVALVLPPCPPAVEGAAETQDSAKRWRLDGPHPDVVKLRTFLLGRNRLAVPLTAADDERLIVHRLAEVSEGFDLAEPFQRIRDAIEEARRGGT